MIWPRMHRWMPLFAGKTAYSRCTLALGGTAGGWRQQTLSEAALIAGLQSCQCFSFTAGQMSRKRKSELRQATRGSWASSLHIYGSRHVRAESVGRLETRPCRSGEVYVAQRAVARVGDGLWTNGTSHGREGARLSATKACDSQTSLVDIRNTRSTTVHVPSRLLET